MAMPEAVEIAHFGKPSFRIDGRIFATVPDPGHLNVMIDPIEVDGVVRAEPRASTVLKWGNEVAGVRVDLKQASRRLVGDLLEAAWRRKAPRRLLGAPGQAKRRRRHGDDEVPAGR
jgi:hypothetical protein